MFTGCSLPPATCLQMPCVFHSMPQVFNVFRLSLWFFAPCHRSALPSPFRAYDLRRRLAACVVVFVNVPPDGFQIVSVRPVTAAEVSADTLRTVLSLTVKGIVHPPPPLVNTFSQFF